MGKEALEQENSWHEIKPCGKGDPNPKQGCSSHSAPSWKPKSRFPTPLSQFSYGKGHFAGMEYPSSHSRPVPSPGKGKLSSQIPNKTPSKSSFHPKLNINTSPTGIIPKFSPHPSLWGRRFLSKKKKKKIRTSLSTKNFRNRTKIGHFNTRNLPQIPLSEQHKV